MSDFSIPGGIWVLLLFAMGGCYVHFRGKVRHRFSRQLFDHSTIMSPINCLLYAFSKAPSTPYHNPKDYPALQLLEDNWETIRDEALALQSQQRIVASQNLDDVGFNSFFRTGWKRFYLKWYGNDLNSANEMCPKTVALLKQVPSIKAAMFASLPPGAKLQQHRDPYAGSLRYHLALTAPGDEKCAIYVDGEPYVWHDGESVMFDETFIHYAKNDTEQQRIVLFCDVVRPMWFAPASWINALFSRVVMGAAVSKNQPGDKVGAINKLFGYVYGVRLLGKKIKVKNKPLYYLLKYLLFALIIWALFF